MGLRTTQPTIPNDNPDLRCGEALLHVSPPSDAEFVEIILYDNRQTPPESKKYEKIFFSEGEAQRIEKIVKPLLLEQDYVSYKFSFYHCNRNQKPIVFAQLSITNQDLQPRGLNLDVVNTFTAVRI